MTDQVKKSDTELAVAFIERGQNALGQANVMILVRPEKLMEKIEKEIEKVRCKIEELYEQIRQASVIDRAIMSSDAWQKEANQYLLTREVELIEKQTNLDRDVEFIGWKISRQKKEPNNRDYDLTSGKEYRTVEIRRLEHSNTQTLRTVALREYERRKTDPKYYDQYVSERRKTISEAEALRDQQIAAFHAEMRGQFARIEKLQGYISLLIEKSIGST